MATYVTYPGGGEHYMLVHWTHNTQTHITLARSPNAILHTVSTRKFLHDSPRIDQLVRINIVQPPVTWQAAKAERDELAQQTRFLTHACSQAKSYASEFGTYPAGFGPCVNYELKSSYIDDLTEDEQADDLVNDRHTYCANCQSGVTSTDADMLRRLYKKHAAKSPGVEQWWRCGGPEPKQTASRAPFADESMPIYAVSRGGFGLIGIDSSHIITAEDWSFNALFYYQNPSSQDDLLERVRSIVSADEESRRREAELRANDRKMRDDTAHCTRLTEFFSV